VFPFFAVMCGETTATLTDGKKISVTGLTVALASELSKQRLNILGMLRKGISEPAVAIQPIDAGLHGVEDQPPVGMSLSSSEALAAAKAAEAKECPPCIKTWKALSLPLRIGGRRG